MKEKDDLAKILKKGKPSHVSIDLENAIMERIEIQDAYAAKVKAYKRYGKISFLVSLILLALYIWNLAGLQGFSLFSNLYTQLTFTGIGLLLIFLELEMGVKKLSFFKR